MEKILCPALEIFLTKKKFRFFLTTLLISFLLFSSLMPIVKLPRAYAENGSVEDPWIINDCDDLQAVGSDDGDYAGWTLGSHYALGDDIECLETSEWNSNDLEVFPLGIGNGEQTIFSFILKIRNDEPIVIYVDDIAEDPEDYTIDFEARTVTFDTPPGNGLNVTADFAYYQGFIPIGKFVNDFSGSLTGNGYVISDLFINRTNSGVGLFDDLSEVAVVSDFGLEDVDVTGTSYEVGGLAGASYGSIENVYTTGVIRGESYVGGLVGGNHAEDTIIDSYSTATIYGWGGRIGGLVGENGEDGTIYNSFATGDVIALGPEVYSVGGLVGSNYGKIFNSYARGDVEGNNRIGGLVGINQLLGMINYAYSVGDVSGNENIGGLVGENDRGKIFNSFWDIETSGFETSAGGTGKTTTEMQDIETYTIVQEFGPAVYPTFDGRYYDDEDFTNLLLLREDEEINFNWGTGSPDDLVPSDDFWVRWEKELELEQETMFKFVATSDDGIRVYVDEELVIDEWNIQGAATFEAFVTISAGVHDIVIEYFEAEGLAVAQFYWIELESGSLGLASPWDFEWTWFLDEDEYPELFQNGLFEGEGGSLNPFLIVACGQLQNINHHRFSHFSLENDLDCGEIYPITRNVIEGEEEDDVEIIDGFAGVFRGNDHSITFSVNLPEQMFAGLFGLIEGATISDLHLNASVTARRFVGSLAGISRNTTEIDNVTAEVEINGASVNRTVGRVGGLIGRTIDTDITDSHVSGTVNAVTTEEIFRVGGLIGSARDTFITESSFSGSMEVQANEETGRIGGLVGYYSFSEEDTVFEDNHVEADIVIVVEGDDLESVGGVIGELDLEESTISGSSFTGNINIQVFDDDVEGVGGFAGYICRGIEEDAFNCQIVDSSAMGNIIIEVTGEGGLTRVGGFVGEASSSPTIQNSFTEVDLDLEADEGVSFIGGFVGQFNSGLIDQAYAMGNVTGSGEMGGFVGFNGGGGDIYNAYATGNVIGECCNIGGFIGFNEGDIYFAYATGAVESGDESYNVGGFAGYNGADSIFSSYSVGTVTAGDNSSRIGGFIGFNDFHSFDNSGWWTGAGPANAIGDDSHEEDPIALIQYNEANPAVFYSALHPIYTTELEEDDLLYYLWDFEEVWAEQEDNYPIFLWQLPGGEDEEPTPPTVTTSSATNITKNKVTLNGNITDTGLATVTARGFNYGLTQSYGSTVSQTGSFSTGTFSLSVHNLVCGQTYHFRAFATNVEGTAYGDNKTVTTDSCGGGGGGGGSLGSKLLPSDSPTTQTSDCLPGYLYSPSTGSQCPPIPPTETPVKPTCVIISLLKQGSRGEEVRCLQTILGNLVIDGIFGPKTRQAVINFQRANPPLVPDGIVGPKTRAVLLR